MFFLIQNLAYGDQSIEGVWKGSAWGDFLKIECYFHNPEYPITFVKS